MFIEFKFQDVFQSVINETTPSLLAGVYSLLVSYCWNHRSASNDIESVLTWDVGGTPIILGKLPSSTLTHKQEPKDSGGNTDGTGSAQQYSWSKTFIIEGVTSGTKDITLTFRTDVASGESSIWDVVYILNRIG